MSKVFSCYILGEESLATQCAEFMLSQGHRVLGIISSKSTIREWAYARGVPYIDSDSPYEDLLLKTDFDYLLSIVNPHIVSAALLKKPRCLSINYHDGLLPRYAGVNATSWAILNHEHQHGITWHVMTEQVDAGDVLKQVVVAIEENETVLSLNLKCYQAALESFKALILEFGSETYVRKPQNLTQRTYYAYHQKPAGNGWIAWNNAAQNLEQLYRALKFGDYPNRLSVLKLQLGQQSYVIDQLQVLDVISTKPAGTLVRVDKELQIATKTHDLLVTQLKTLDNQLCDMTALAQKHHLKIDKKLPSPIGKHQTAYQKMSEEIFKHEIFWVRQLSQCKPMVLPFLQVNSEAKVGRSHCVFTFKLSETLEKSLKNVFSIHEDQADVVLTAFLIYLQRINSEGQVCINFTYPDLQEKTASFSSLIANFVPLNIAFDQKADFFNALEIIKQKHQEIKRQQTYLKDVYVRYPELKQACREKTIGLIYHGAEQKIPLEQFIYPINILLENNSLSLYLSHAIQHKNLLYFLASIPGHLQRLLEGVVINPHQSIHDLPLLTPAEQKKILVDWNTTYTDYPRDKTVSQLFKEQVEKTPDNIAVVFEACQLTYRQLDKRSNQLAFYLKQQGVKPSTPVAICLERGLELVISMLAIIKAGGIYVPLDPDSPPGRIEHILEDSQAQFILMLAKDAAAFCQTTNIHVILFENIIESELSDNPISDPKLSSSAPIYLMYTSGSTGTPKGVIVLHRNVVNLVKNSNCIGIRSSDSVSQMSNVTFDAAMLEIWGALLNGAKLVIFAKNALLTSSVFVNMIVQEKISFLCLTTALFNQICELNPEVLYLVNYLMIGGEKANIEICKEFIRRRKNKSQIFLNGYGPTETTAFSTCYTIDNKINELNSIPIGKPISNTQCYVLDTHLQPVPVGVVGELCIGGEGVSAGYLKQPLKTQQSFIPHPFGVNTDDRLYRTGDKVRWLPDGNLEYIGRSDDQIKLRGFRIELQEIEAVLVKHPQISQAIVCIRTIDNLHKQLEAYIVCEKNQRSVNSALDSEALTLYLKHTLPDYMIPTRFFVVDQFPLTMNGKVNKAALMENHPLHLDKKTIKTPHSPTESVLVDIWQRVLKIPQVSTDDNFFLLGGDSIIAMQIVAKANQAGLSLAVQDIFQHPVICDLASRFTEKAALESELIRTNKKFDIAPIQAWFFDQPLAKPAYFSQVALLRMHGSVDVELLERCFTILLERHDALRLRFALNAKRTWQQYYARAKKPTDKIIQSVDSSNCEGAALHALIQHWTDQLPETFNLATGPLLKAALFSGHAKHSRQLLIVVHHLIIDGVSWRILLEELQTLYQRFIGAEKLAVTSMKSSSYHAWIDSLSNQVALNDLKDEQAFWLSVDQHVCVLPIDHRKGKNVEQSTRSVSVKLTEQETKDWLQGLSIQQEGIKPHEVLIALLAKTLAAFTKSDGIRFDLENHGREPLLKPLNLSQTIGWFTSLFPVYLTVDDNSSLKDIVRSIKKQLQKILRHGIGYGWLRYVKKVHFSHDSEVAFNYWGQFDQIFDQQSFTFDSLRLVSHPENQRTHLLNVDAMVKNKQLTLVWTYSVNFHKANTIKQLAQNYREDLRNLIKNCRKNIKNSVDCSLIKLPFEQVNPYVKDVETVEGVYPLSPLQQGLLFHAVQAPNSEAYMVQLVWRVPTELDFCINTFIQAWQAVVKRHAILRTSFLWEELAEPIQVVRKSAELPCNTYDWLNCLDQNAQEERLRSFLRADRQVGFNFTCSPLARLTVIELPNKQYDVVATFHHILLDGWSLSLLIKEIDYFYQGIQHKNLLPLQSPTPYAHYLKWLQEQDTSAAKNFWQNYLSGFSEATDLAISSTHTPPLDTQGKVDIIFDDKALSPEFAKQLRKFCQAHQVTLSTLFQGIWALVLSRYSQSDDVVFGVTYAGRSAQMKDVEDIVGLLINTLPLRINLAQTDSVKDYLSKIQTNLFEISEYAYASLTDLTSWSDIENGKSLFHSILVFENYPNVSHESHWFKLANTEIIDPTHYPLSCIIVPGDSFVIRLAYDQNVIASESIRNLQGHLHTLLTDIIHHPHKNIHQLHLLTRQEQQCLTDWNKTQADYPFSKTIHQLFEEQVQKTPDNLAIVFEGQQLTYRQLNEQANQLARYLKKRGLESEQVVAIFLDRGLNMMIALLAVLKAGGAYLPIDLKYPPERISYMLEDSNALLLLTETSVWQEANLRELDRDTLVFLDQTSHYSNELSNNLNLMGNSQQLMYVMYTSGSTGTPKGVLIEHRSVVNFLTTMCLHIKPSANDAFLALTPLIFDISGLELYLPLIVGACCVMVSSETAVDGNQLKEIITNDQISIVQATPMTWKMLLAANWSGSDSLKVLCGGEALSTELGKQLFEKVGHFWNLYGPTETTIWSTINAVSDVNETRAIVPIGKPLGNTDVYVLDHQKQLAPIGRVGELYIGGEGLARSYLNRPELTQEKFIAHPFEKKARLYRTGDLVRWLPDGNLEYLGRVDEQVKVNGFRIELGEIQACLEKNPSILQAAVISRDNAKGEKYLVAYVIPRVKTAFDPQVLRIFLQQFFPYAMVPSVFIALDKFPLTPSGKLDKKALPTLEEQPNFLKAYIAPRNEDEKVLADMWAKILNLSQIGIHDDFFALGAHSLSALQLLAKIRQYFKINLPMRVLFEHTTIAQLVDAIKGMQSEAIILNATMTQRPTDALESCLVQLKKEGRKSPLFLIHPIGGTIFWYIPLIKYFDPDRPLYAIQDPGIEMEKIPFETTEKMASFYIKAIKTAQPEGPYLIAGSSAGANVSVEMSYQLQKKGEKVIFVGLLDGWAFYPESLQNQVFFETIMRKQYNDMENSFIAKGIDKAEKLLKLQWARSKMNNRYRAPYLSNKLTLFKAEKTLDIFESIEESHNHWEKHSPFPVELHTVPGDHETMFQEPNASVLAEKLNQCLNESEAAYEKEKLMKTE